MTTLKEFLEKEENKEVRSVLARGSAYSVLGSYLISNPLDKTYVRTTKAIDLVHEILSKIKEYCFYLGSSNSLRLIAYYSVLDEICDKANAEKFKDLSKAINYNKRECDSKVRIFKSLIKEIAEHQHEVFDRYYPYGSNSSKDTIRQQIKEIERDYEAAWIECLDDDSIDFLLTEECEGDSSNAAFIKLLRDLRRNRNNIEVMDFRDYISSSVDELSCILVNYCFTKYDIDETIKHMIKNEHSNIIRINEYTNERSVNNDFSRSIIDATPETMRKDLIDCLIIRLGEHLGKKKVFDSMFYEYFKIHGYDNTFKNKIAFIIDNYATINGDCLVQLYKAIKSYHTTYGIISKIEELAYSKNEDGKRIYSEMIQRLIIAMKCCLTKSMSLKDKKTLGEIGTFVEIYHFDYEKIVEATYASEGMNYKY